MGVPIAVRDRWRVLFFKQVEVMPGDTDIIMYLTEVVKEQQALEMQGARSANVPPVVRLDYAVCSSFKNINKKQ